MQTKPCLVPCWARANSSGCELFCNWTTLRKHCNLVWDQQLGAFVPTSKYYWDHDALIRRDMDVSVNDKFRNSCRSDGRGFISIPVRRLSLYFASHQQAAEASPLLPAASIHHARSPTSTPPQWGIPSCSDVVRYMLLGLTSSDSIRKLVCYDYRHLAIDWSSSQPQTATRFADYGVPQSQISRKIPAGYNSGTEI